MKCRNHHYHSEFLEFISSLFVGDFVASVHIRFEAIYDAKASYGISFSGNA